MELAEKEHLTHFQPMFHFYTLLKQKFFNPLSASVALIWLCQCCLHMVSIWGQHWHFNFSEWTFAKPVMEIFRLDALRKRDYRKSFFGGKFAKLFRNMFSRTYLSDKFKFNFLAYKHWNGSAHNVCLSKSIYLSQTLFTFGNFGLCYLMNFYAFQCVKYSQLSQI